MKCCYCFLQSQRSGGLFLRPPSYPRLDLSERCRDNPGICLTTVVPEFCFFSRWSLAVTKVICSAISTSVSMWLTDNSTNSEIFCFLWIRGQPGMSTALVWTVLHLAGKALTMKYPAPARFNPQFPEKRVSGSLPPMLSIPCSKSFKLQWSGTHEANPAMVSHCQVKCTLEDMEEQWGAGMHCYRMLWALITPGPQAAFSLNQNIAPYLECQDTQGSPLSAAASRIPAASKICWLSATDMKSLCLPAHKGFVGCIWPQARLPLCLPVPLWPHLD